MSKVTVVTTSQVELDSVVSALVENNHGCVEMEQARSIVVALKRRGWGLEPPPSASRGSSRIGIEAGRSSGFVAGN